MPTDMGSDGWYDDSQGWIDGSNYDPYADMTDADLGIVATADQSGLQTLQDSLDALQNPDNGYLGGGPTLDDVLNQMQQGDQNMLGGGIYDNGYVSTDGGYTWDYVGEDTVRLPAMTFGDTGFGSLTGGQPTPTTNASGLPNASGPMYGPTVGSSGSSQPASPNQPSQKQIAYQYRAGQDMVTVFTDGTTQTTKNYFGTAAVSLGGANSPGNSVSNTASGSLLDSLLGGFTKQVLTPTKTTTTPSAQVIYGTGPGASNAYGGMLDPGIVRIPGLTTNPQPAPAQSDHTGLLVGGGAILLGLLAFK